MPQSLNIAICEDEVAETKLLCDILDHSDIKNSYTVFTGSRQSQVRKKGENLLWI